MRISVDRERCEANQVCMRVAPEAFRIDEKDHLHVLVEEVAPHLRERVERAVKLCPRQALALVAETDVAGG
jgi:ferredoxin